MEKEKFEPPLGTSLQASTRGVLWPLPGLVGCAWPRPQRLAHQASHPASEALGTAVLLSGFVFLACNS